MQTLLKIVCWVTLFCDVVVGLVCNALTGSFGHGYPHAEIAWGSFKVTSLMPGGGAFIAFIAIWTGVLASAALYFARRAGSRPK